MSIEIAEKLKSQLTDKYVVVKHGIAELKPGDSLLVRFGDGPKGLMAAEVRPLEAALPSSH